MKITLPIHTKVSLNKIYGGIHFSTRSKHKEEFHWIVIAENVPEYPGPFPVEITYNFKLKGRLLDSLNTAYMAKMIEDGLVHEEVLPDDAPKYVRWSRVGCEKGENVVEITIHSL